jgi:hypothetical protein
MTPAEPCVGSASFSGRTARRDASDRRTRSLFLHPEDSGLNCGHDPYVRWVESARTGPRKPGVEYSTLMVTSTDTSRRARSPVAPERSRAGRPLPRWIGRLGYAALVFGLGCGDTAAAPFSIDVALSPTPPTAGPARILVLVTDSTGAPGRDLRVAVAGAPMEGGPAVPSQEAHELEPGVYVVETFPLRVPGDWALEVTVVDPGGASGLLERRVSVVGAPG